MRQDAIGLFWQDIPVTKIKKEKIKKTPLERTWESPNFLPYYEEACRFEVDYYTDQDLINEYYKGQLKEKLVFDIESYTNYFCIAFQGVDSKKIFFCEIFSGGSLNPIEIKKLYWVLENFTVISFNGNDYDIPILTLALNSLTVYQLKEATNLLIVGETFLIDGIPVHKSFRPNDVLKRFKKKKLKDYDHIDLIEVAPLDGSLKIYAGRLHCKKMQDLPYPPDTLLTDEQKVIVRWYCVNDLANTILLYKDLEEAINLREDIGRKYDIDLRSKSDAQIAESIIEKEIYLTTGEYPKRPSEEEIEKTVGSVHYFKVPPFISYKTPNMQWVLQAVASSPFVVGASGRVTMPKELEGLEIPLGDAVYSMGIGGLHSTEKTISYISDEEYIIVDRDVTSYYPRIIINSQLYPRHLGPNFLRVYSGIVERRIAAKVAGDKLTADTLKITVNGSFGKTGNKYSLLYEPNLVIQTTVTGQLSLLMLIERLLENGFLVISANTDGIVTKVKRDRKVEFDAILSKWEKDTGFETEEALYLALYSRDVNNYIALKDTKKTDIYDRVKLKGAYGKADLKKNPQNEICNEAVIRYLLDKTPIQETIIQCKDLRKFVTVRKVKGGAAKQYPSHIPAEIIAMSKEEVCLKAGYEQTQDKHFLINDLKYDIHDAYGFAIKTFEVPGKVEYLGSTVRWYYSTEVEGEIVITKTGGKVPKSDGAKPMMEFLDEFPNDIDYEWYINESYSILKDIGACL